ncbi:FHA domain-containing protein [Actinomadura roseirufa]|uniref:FHA domain-containing protein n=1 Tax=Actinomadura roseirufa TaxID=2094049 RepID=UPI001040F7EE|nr:FHA domain-containing protein [Actinomadura roseirufa]
MLVWDAVIDVSNVCWSPLLPPHGRRAPVWRRLELVMNAWRELHGGARFELVADDSLARTLDDARGLRRLIGTGELVTRPLADALILELARDRGLHVITRDHYVDHRGDHPWIETAPERFHRWRADGAGVRFEPLGITPSSRQTVSAAREGKDLRRSRLDPRNPLHRRILGTRWTCRNVLCPEAAHWQDQLLVWPRLNRAGDAVCPTCEEPLLGLGPRDPLYEMVVEDRASGGEILRFPLEVGCPVVVGRGSRLKGVNLGVEGTAHPEAVRQVSRRHLLLRMDVDGTNRRLAVTDLGARNGTRVERWDGTALGPPKAVAADRELFLGFKDRLLLGDAVTLRLSGRHYVTHSGMTESYVSSSTNSQSAPTLVRDSEAAE